MLVPNYLLKGLTKKKTNKQKKLNQINCQATQFLEIRWQKNAVFILVNLGSPYLYRSPVRSLLLLQLIYTNISRVGCGYRQHGHMPPAFRYISHIQTRCIKYQLDWLRNFLLLLSLYFCICTVIFAKQRDFDVVVNIFWIEKSENRVIA